MNRFKDKICLLRVKETASKTTAALAITLFLTNCAWFALRMKKRPKAALSDTLTTVKQQSIYDEPLTDGEFDESPDDLPVFVYSPALARA